MSVRVTEVGDERIREATGDNCSKATLKVCPEKLEIKLSDKNILQVGKIKSSSIISIITKKRREVGVAIYDVPLRCL